MGKSYLDIKESALLVSRHERTIRRVIVQKRETINKIEGYSVIKYTKRKYYISTDYLHKRYNIPKQKRQTTQPPKTEDTEELRELRETIKMYSIMLEAKDNEIRGLKEEKSFLKTQCEIQNKNLDRVLNSLEYAQKLNALDKKITFKSD